jgi:hypothetical protein
MSEHEKSSHKDVKDVEFPNEEGIGPDKRLDDKTLLDEKTLNRKIALCLENSSFAYRILKDDNPPIASGIDPLKRLSSRYLKE